MNVAYSALENIHGYERNARKTGIAKPKRVYSYGGFW